jgi:hypothetical protein
MGAFMLVDNPILNSPFEEPARYWAYEEGQPVLKEGRRPAGYYLKPRTPGPQMSLFEEEFVPLELVNPMRERVKARKIMWLFVKQVKIAFSPVGTRTHAGLVLCLHLCDECAQNIAR